MRSRGGLIRLAENPLEDPLLGGGEEDPMGGGVGMPPEEPGFGEEPEDPMGEELAYKGRSISGPRMKLSYDRRLSNIERATSDQTEILASLAKSSAILGKAVVALLRKEDDDKDEKEDKSVRKGRMSKEFESDTAVGGDKSEPADRGRPEDETMNEPGLQDDRGSLEVKGRVRKDDASGNFGEKDSDMPGNRQVVPDEKDKDASEILIQGDASDGPGVMVSAAVKAELDLARDAVLAKHGLIRKAISPMIGSGPAPAAADADELFERARGMSFAELARMRVQMGDLSAGLI